VLDNILCNIICYTFDDLIGRGQYQKHFDGETMHGMEITFKLHETDYKAPDKFPGVQLLIFAPSTHVGVYYRVSETRDEYGPYQHLSKHDSCWRYDGVERFLRMFGRRDEDTGRGDIAVLGWHGGGICNNKWYDKVEISKEFADELQEVTRAKRDSWRTKKDDNA
jgi:hypothetical protein